MKYHPKKSQSFRAGANPMPFCGNGICFVLGNDNRESSQKNNYHHRHIKRSWGRGSFTILGKAYKKWRNWENSTTWKRYKGQHSFLLLWKVRELLKRVNNKNERGGNQKKKYRVQTGGYSTENNTIFAAFKGQGARKSKPLTYRDHHNPSTVQIREATV